MKLFLSTTATANGCTACCIYTVQCMTMNLTNTVHRLLLKWGIHSSYCTRKISYKYRLPISLQSCRQIQPVCKFANRLDFSRQKHSITQEIVTPSPKTKQKILNPQNIQGCTVCNQKLCFLVNSERRSVCKNFGRLYCELKTVQMLEIFLNACS